MERIKCGDYSCSREAKQVPVGLVIGEYEDEPEDERENSRSEQAARAVRCNIHVGAEKRRTWGIKVEYEPIANRADIRLLCEGRIARLRAAQAVEREKNEQDRRAKAEVRYAEEWLGWGADEYKVVNDKSEYSRENAGVRNVKVVPEGDHRSWNEWDVTTEQSSRYDDLPHPVYVRINRTGSMSPNEARALAKALNLMADRVDAANTLIQQNGE